MPSKPFVTAQDPVPNATGIDRDTPIKFSIRDEESLVSRPTIAAYVNGALIYNGLANTFAVDWEDSTIDANAFNGFDFVLVPGLFARFDYGQIVTVRVVGQDESANELDERWSFVITTEMKYRTRIYDMLLGSVRKRDEVP